MRALPVPARVRYALRPMPAPVKLPLCTALVAAFLAVGPVRAAEEGDLPARIDALMEARRWAEARPLAAEWVAKLEKAGKSTEPLVRAQARHVLGSLQDRLGDHEAALATLAAAADDYGRASAEPALRAACEEEAARAAQAVGRLTDAEKWLRQALARRPGADAAPTQAQLAELLVKSGRFDEAGALLRQARPGEDDAAGKFLLARAAGVLSHSLGRYDEAIRHFRDARTVAASLGDEGEALRASVEGQIGQSWFRMGRLADAEKALEATFAFFSRNTAGADEALAALNNLTAVWLASGRAREAVERLEASPLLHAAGNGPEAITLWLNLGAAAVRADKADTARRALDRARELADTFLPKVHLLHGQIAATRQALALREKDATVAREQAQMASTQALNWMQRLRGWGSEEEWLEFRRTLDPVSPLATVGSAAAAELADAVLVSQGVALDELLRRRARRASGESAATAADVAATLPADAALVNFTWWQPVSFAAAPPRYGALVLTKGGLPQWIDLGAADVIETRLRRIIATARDTVAANAPVKDRAALDFQLSQLRSLVWDPVAPLVRGKPRLLLRPDGMLQFVPWAVLREEGGGAFFCQTHPRVTVLGQARRLPPMANPARGWRVLAVSAAPVGGEALFSGEPPPPLTPDLWHDLQEMPALPGTQAEAAAIRAAAGERVPISEPAPVEAAFATAPAPRVLHFCGHGFASEPDSLNGAPLLRAGLVMADCAQGLRALAAGTPRPAATDGLLFSTDAAALDLEATELVVLSGCQTGLGHWQPGEHLAGLRHAFFIAGVRHVASTLWDLNDAAAPDLVRRFYARLADGAAPPDALWDTQREMLAEPGETPPALRAAWVGAWIMESAGW